MFAAFQKQRFFIIGCVVALWGVGVFCMDTLPVEPVPDISPKQVLVSATVPDLATEEVEKLITFPVEASLTGIKGVTDLRSVSRTGVSAIYLQFDDATDIDQDRTFVAECLQEAHDTIAVPGVSLTLGPRATGMGEIMQFQIKGRGYSLMDLNRLMRWKVVPQLKLVPGVADVNVNGGTEETFQVALDPVRLRTYGLTVSDVYQAIDRNNQSAGGGWIVHQAEQQVVVGRALISTLNEFANIPLKITPSGPVVRLKDVGDISQAPRTQLGAVTRDGKGEIVTGSVLMQADASSNAVLAAIHKAWPIILQSLPQNVTLETFYQRSTLTHETITTVKDNLLLGAGLVVVVLIVILGEWRASLVIASAIPAALCAAMIGMRYFGVSANLLSLGAIDFGMIVDSSLVVVEHFINRRREKIISETVAETAIESARAVVKPVSFAIFVIILVYLPILTLEDIEGKMFRPMAQTVVMALLASLVYCFAVIPVLSVLLLHNVNKGHETRVITFLHHYYTLFLTWSLSHRKLVLSAMLCGCAGAGLLALHLGGEFVPQLEEGDVTVTAVRLPSASLPTVLDALKKQETILRSFPEVKTVVTTTGTSAIPTDPMGVNESDSYVLLKPRSEWSVGQTQAHLVAQMAETLEEKLPSADYEWSQPIQMRMDDLLAGVRTQLAISIYGNDLQELDRLSHHLTGILTKIPGAVDVAPQGAGTVPFIHIDVDREAAARHGVQVTDVMDQISAIGGWIGTSLMTGQAIIPTQIRLKPEVIHSVETIKGLPIRRADGSGWIPLSDVARISVENGVSRIDRDHLQRRVVVQANVRGRDVSSFVAEAQKTVERDMPLPAGYHIEWAGQFRNLNSALARLSIVLPIALVLIFGLLVVALESVGAAALIFVNLPVAASGGVFALYGRDMPFSIAAGIGFIALFGVAILNGVVLVSQIQTLRKQGINVRRAVIDATQSRFRPVVATASVASIGFFPMAFSGSMGAEVEKPLATVVIGGLLTSTLLTLCVLPTLYIWFFERHSFEA
ncbi:CusA/CzcA family heavy metal efflux RND transporter [Saccharibacter sp. 17.LH.SD]|uniref:efflux RND transporter permease subunit n=1 Tax=Saccharibacter sp. 17.LH.SD TaxID=2689393 RepID=UPI0013702B53|nr:CusA/CzcA family heavy metal efflux RND transporter [Saccharibacter sp. 17.LH.SD]MXV43942.1 CusA/CzcA family heavy metal efflux RND transporter [Saccharibacter sp. 17.LH.SD]